ncbi:hypothetical protein CPC08DRAFT_682742 [Agrocybe pediades]|nr:hypothetical protein CPC08DRAFT_682742 [Agrocybe pediades]
MASPTYDIFFTGRDDPRSCVIIGEDTKPIYFCFETVERNPLTPTVRTMVYRNNKELCAKLEWSPGNHLGGATIGNRQMPMPHLILPSQTHGARAFISGDGKKFEWRRSRDVAGSYDLFSSHNVRLAAFRRFTQPTAIGPSHAILQYTFLHDTLLMEALVALCVVRWVDIHGV